MAHLAIKLTALATPHRLHNRGTLVEQKEQEVGHGVQYTDLSNWRLSLDNGDTKCIGL